MVTKIGLPENRKRLRGSGIEYERSRSFDEGYNIGFEIGVEYGKRIARGEVMPTPEGVISTSTGPVEPVADKPKEEKNDLPVVS